MRLLLVTPQYPPILGGAELQAQRLAQAFAKAGVRVTVLTRPCPGQQGEDSDSGVRIMRKLSAVPLGPIWGLTFMRSTARWLRRLQSDWDVVHNQQVGLHSWASVREAIHLGRPCLLRFACSGPQGDLGELSRRRFGKRLVHGLRRAGRFVALTHGGASEIIRYGLAPERIRTIPNGIDLSAFKEQTWPRLTAADPIRLLFVGRLNHQKGLDVLLDALTLVRDPHRFQLRVIGSGDQLDALRLRASRAGLERVVEFYGSRHDVLPEYAWSELVVFPSRFEGMPNVVLEAMACARPVLGTSIDGTADLVAQDTSGWLVQSEDPRALAEALAHVERHREHLPSVGLEGRKIVETRYAMQRIAAMYLSEYESLLSESRKKRRD
jgi:glycosyltransferase involved in cell wall biosynthesis